MELLCALLGKAPLFGLMTDEGRMAKWLVEVKTTKVPDWGVVGTAIGRKVVEDVPYITGLDKYFGGKVTNQNMHLLKAMGSATASSGAVGLYHVEGVTPDAKEKGKELLVEGYQTYVIDDAEHERVRKGFSERVNGVTNSAKTRNYSNVRYFPDDVLLEIVLTGKMPKDA